MDPEATLADIIWGIQNSGYRKLTRETKQQAADLLCWLAKGGFSPTVRAGALADLLRVVSLENDKG
jgi:hypothetical protein